MHFPTETSKTSMIVRLGHSESLQLYMHMKYILQICDKLYPPEFQSK